MKFCKNTAICSESDGSQHFDDVKPLVSTVGYGGVFFNVVSTERPKSLPFIFPVIHRLRFQLIIEISRINDLKVNVIGS
ncbi:hypothetical protein AKJ16_DCAP24345 [Drosera capensis]